MIASLILLLSGIVLRFFPPKKVNSIYGYRTRSSMKNQDTWKFANNYAGMWLIRINSFLLMVSILLLSWPLSWDMIELYLMIPVIFGIGLLISRTEKYLRILFDENGNRRQIN